jgi:DNA uptake protein ComE-like DNA-binding protein
MKTSIRRAFVLGFAIVLAQACASPEKKEQAPNASSPPPSAVLDQQAGSAPVLGQQSAEAGTAEIERRRVVTERTEVPTLKTTSTKADLNRVSAEHLMALGVSRDLAENIIEYRQEHGSFKATNELLEVDGMNAGAYRSLSRKVGVARTG